MNRLLLCPPDFYGVRYSINPWMDPARAVDHERAMQQWEALKFELEGLGCQVEVMRPQPEWPDLVFTANAALVIGNHCLLSHFKYPERQGETRWYRKWLGAEGYVLATLDEGVCFEGEGDALYCGSSLYCGYGFRTDEAACRMVSRRLGGEVIALQLVNPHFYHLDTCFCPLARGLALWYPGAFGHETRSILEKHVDRLIAVSSDEAACFGCNAIVVGNDVVLPAGCSELSRELIRYHYVPHPVEMSEFIKAGGACKCLVLTLDRPRVVN